jgi:hypothetical protein
LNKNQIQAKIRNNVEGRKLLIKENSQRIQRLIKAVDVFSLLMQKLFLPEL